MRRTNQYVKRNTFYYIDLASYLLRSAMIKSIKAERFQI